MKYLIAGLGNIGEEYANTRHNAGFLVLDAMAESAGAPFVPDRLAAKSILKHKGRTLVLIKPSTYMNLSGKALNYWMQAEKIPLENVLIVTDDLALPFGTLRLREKGGSGGHNGLQNIEETLGTNTYSRLRFGIGSDFAKGSQVNFVLSPWGQEEQLKLKELATKAADIIKSFTTDGVKLTMTRFNNQ